MKRRALRWTIAVLVVLLALDTAIWLLAVGAVGRTVEAWAAQQRAAGLTVTTGPSTPCGWPFAAGLRYPALSVGPGGVPGGVSLRVAGRITVAPARFTVARADIDTVEASAPDASKVVATAAAWTVEIPLGAPAPVVAMAQALRFRQGGRQVVVDMLKVSAQRLSAQSLVSSGNLGDDLHVVAALRNIDLAGSGLVLPQDFGPLVRAVDFDGTLQNLPQAPIDATSAAWARIWQAGGGRIRVASASVQYGSLNATAQGEGGLDAQLRPSGTASVTARGLPALLDALGANGMVAPRAGMAARGVFALFGGAESDITLPVTAADGLLLVAGFPLARLAQIR